MFKVHILSFVHLSIFTHLPILYLPDTHNAWSFSQNELQAYQITSESSQKPS